MSVRSVRRAIECLLLTIAIVCLSWYGWRRYEIRRAELALTAQIHGLDGRDGRDEAIPPGIPADGVIGEIEIPRLKLTAPIKAGDDENALDFSVGYLPDTPLPWLPGNGNSAFAAHRDRLFRALERIHAGDDIKLSTRHGEFNYRVVNTMIVDPKDVWVLNAQPHVNLTLITCYPFVYVGHAPHRFIVQAERLDAID
jgi:sortase A